jgi:PilZ domain
MMVFHSIAMKRIFDLLLSTPCSHEFSWPRKTATGAYYQVCLRCGDHYWYDWKKMQRTSLIDPSEQHTLAQPVRTRWSPRARRFNVSIDVQFRRKNSEAWSHGTITNISQSGVLLTADQELQLPRHAAIEMIFEMPGEISGQPHSDVLCDAYVVRAISASQSPSIAVAILEYKFMHAEVAASALAADQAAAPSAEAPATGSALMHRRRFRLRTRESRSSR